MVEKNPDFTVHADTFTGSVTPSDQHNAKGKGCQGIHGVIALQETGKEAVLGILPRDLRLGCASHRIQKRRYNEDRHEQQEQGIQNLSHPGQYFRRAKGEKQDGSKKQKGKHR